MNNYISSARNWFSKSNEKISKWTLNNKKTINFFIIFIISCLFVLPFCMYLFSGIGLHKDLSDENIKVSWNGVWFIKNYIGVNGLDAGRGPINSWESLLTYANGAGFENASTFFNQAYTFYQMNYMLLPIWVTFFIILIIYIVCFVCYLKRKKIQIKLKEFKAKINKNKIEEKKTEVKENNN